MPRRISTKWILAVLAAVVVPFVGFAWLVNDMMATRLEDVVRYYLQSLAADLAGQIDRELEERRLDVELLADNPITAWSVGDFGGQEVDMRSTLVPLYDSFVERSAVYDLVLAVDAEGRLAAANSRDARGAPLAAETRAELRARSYAEEPWFRESLADGLAMVDHHVSDLLPPRKTTAGPHPENFHFGIAVAVQDPVEPGLAIGVVYALVNWSYIQYELLKPTQRAYFQGLIGPDIYASSYPWIWAADADTIIAHPKRDLYGKSVSRDVGLPQLVAAARAAEQGMYPEYTFDGERKNAAFQHLAGPEQDGFGWVLGIGIDNEDIYATVYELRRLLWTATLAVLAAVVSWTVVIARRTTRPILELQRHTRRVAAGDLDARIVVDSRDELGALAADFNRMTEELAQSRAELVKAEKERAWREMARQVAHEIKNPLTPIRLSVDLLRRAHAEGSPDFDAIFQRTIDLVQRQVANMREIASDFSAFAGARRRSPEPVDVLPLAEEILELDRAWAEELGVEVRCEGTGGRVHTDRGELRRLLINLVSNALEAMPDGGRLVVSARTENGTVEIVVRDTGPGVSAEARERLFEPYFTTRTHGTGLGLAICRRIVEEMGGALELVSARDGGAGTEAIVRVPQAPPDEAEAPDAGDAAGPEAPA